MSCFINIDQQDKKDQLIHLMYYVRAL